MRKLTVLLTAVLLSTAAAFSQPVSDSGVIPVGVTLNSILRLNITSGGNLEYVVNTIDQYTNGIPQNARYDTHFTVASSVDFDVSLTADAATFIGVDDATHTIPLDNLGYLVVADAGASGSDGVNWDLPGTVLALSSSPVNIVESNYTGLGAGDINQNAFVIQWRLGTRETNMNSTSLLEQSITSDRYVVNAIIQLSQH
ncbi:MAG: hypothetical protein GXO50_01490 [Chlorobi bacterium]|nr:hypothetical protein [Chlorobiota bacterium]